MNTAINAITRQMTSEDLIGLLKSITVPASNINPIDDVLQDPLVKKQLLFAKDPITSRQITLSPPPIMTPFIKDRGGNLAFPPRFGEHNDEIYGKKLGYDVAALEDLKNRSII
jgi:formyl-CoA transferase